MGEIDMEPIGNIWRCIYDMYLPVAGIYTIHKQYVAQYTEQRSHWRSIEIVYWYPYAKASYSSK